MLKGESMEALRSIRRTDHGKKASGQAKYLDDCQVEGLLHGHILYSPVAKGIIKEIHIPPLPPGYLIVDHNDVPDNHVHIVLDDTPVFADGKVECIGEPILMVVGPDKAKVDEILSDIEIDYETLEPIVDPHATDTYFFEYEIRHDAEAVKKAFEEADFVYEEVFNTGMQEQAYLETQGMIAAPDGDKIAVAGSMQCPYYVHTALKQAFKAEDDAVRVRQTYTGGGFGGKEDYPSIIGVQTAVAAKKAGAPVKVTMTRREDMAYTPKRHPAEMTYKAAVKDGKITAMDIDLLYDSGAYSTLSMVVLQRGLICANGCYNIPALHVHARAAKTNTVPSGAFRGFGAPQVFYAVEKFMDHLAEKLGRDPVEFKQEYFYKEGDTTSTKGKMHFRVPLVEMTEKLDALCDFSRKRAAYARPQTGRYRRGIGYSAIFHGLGFTGNGERDLIKAVARLRKGEDDRVEILAANSEIGQGIETTFTKIVAETLGVPYEQVCYQNPDTDRVPDSGPTVASRSLMVVGYLLEKAAKALKADWKPGEVQEVEVHYEHPAFMIPFDLDTFTGDAYPSYSWSVNAVEVEVDTLTAQTRILGAYGVYDVGKTIDYNVVKGQMAGGMVQSLGYASCEQIGYNGQGRIRNDSFSDYILPTAEDIGEMKIEMIEDNPYPYGPSGAKGGGEMPCVGPAPAYAQALEQALGAPVSHIPFTQEDVMRALKAQKEEAQA